MAFEIWESEHKGNFCRDDETIVVTGSKREQDRPTLKARPRERRQKLASTGGNLLFPTFVTTAVPTPTVPFSLFRFSPRVPVLV